MDDEVIGINQSEDPLTHFALLVNSDPTDFNKAVKELKWWKAIDDEIEAIQRNNT